MGSCFLVLNCLGAEQHVPRHTGKTPELPGIIRDLANLNVPVENLIFFMLIGGVRCHRCISTFCEYNGRHLSKIFNVHHTQSYHIGWVEFSQKSIRILDIL